MGQSEPHIVVHGGAGSRPTSGIDLRMRGCELAAQAGWHILQNGGTALDAAQAAVVILEDDPIFNAGYGSTLNEDGKVETDASIMSGADLSAGAVAGASQIKNPIILARAILDDKRHVLLCGDGAHRFAKHTGFSLIEPEQLVAPTALTKWQEKHGTVGCVARDRFGNIAAATSTGGLFNKLAGRVGDSALIGCGTYANKFAGVSCTGIGEAIIKSVLAKKVTDLVEQGFDAQSAVDQSLLYFGKLTNSEAGIIAIDHLGNIGIGQNTAFMPTHSLTTKGK